MTHKYYTTWTPKGESLSMIGVSKCSPPPHGAISEEVSVARHGELRKEGNLVRQDGLRTLRRLADGVIHTRVIPNYFVEISADAPAGHDICFYCGADNGPEGISRVGWDCYSCGSN